jgi:SAM-dependent methyltransferase
MTVTALDINEGLIATAKKNCQGLPVTLGVADMKKLGDWYNRFDVTVNLFSSFGYFDTDEENEAVAQELIRTVRPKGKVVIHVIDRDWLMKVYEPVSWNDSEATFSMEGRRYDPKTHYNESHIVHIDKATGMARRFYHKMRLYNAREMLELLKGQGLKDVHLIGNFDGGDYEAGVSSHPIYIGTR